MSESTTIPTTTDDFRAQIEGFTIDLDVIADAVGKLRERLACLDARHQLLRDRLDRIRGGDRG